MLFSVIIKTISHYLISVIKNKAVFYSRGHDWSIIPRRPGNDVDDNIKIYITILQTIEIRDTEYRGSVSV